MNSSRAYHHTRVTASHACEIHLHRVKAIVQVLRRITIVPLFKLPSLSTRCRRSERGTCPILCNAFRLGGSSAPMPPPTTHVGDATVTSRHTLSCLPPGQQLYSATTSPPSYGTWKYPTIDIRDTPATPSRLDPQPSRCTKCSKCLTIYGY